MSEVIKLGKLEEVDIRDLWAHEQYDFSKWLSKEENIELLNETVGLNLVNIDTEVFVGSYRCDLVAEDDGTGIKVIIENQLETTDHDHLGKIITYASGLKAEVIIWIVKEAREGHKSAIEWLNNNTNGSVSFFLLELKAYKIGESLPAPKFEIIEKPNDFIQSTKRGNEIEYSQTQADRLEFWTEFNSYLSEKGKPFNKRKATIDHWYDVTIGVGGVHISITLVNKENKIGVDLYISDNKLLFDQLLENKEEIEKHLGFPMIWDRLDNNKASRIKYYIQGLDFNNKDNYKELMDEIINKVVIIRKVFQKYIKDLKS